MRPSRGKPRATRATGRPTPSSLLKGLNPAQREAVTTVEGPLLVLAGAGTGKTRVITTRIAYLLSRGVAPENVLAVTFTNKAAGEMRERVAAVVGKQAQELTVGTFHAFCLRVLREHGKVLGLGSRFTITDAADQLHTVKSVMRELRVHETTMPPSALLARISLLKNQMESPESSENGEPDSKEVLVSRVWEKYQEALRRSRALDFDDLLLQTLQLFRKSRRRRDEYRNRYRYLLVDEYQDTNRVQYEILRQIAGGHRNLCVVGDDDQSIYGWRGADIRRILSFHRDFKGASVVRLETNYRSTAPILDAANAVIHHNPARHEKSLRSASGDGPPVRLTRLKDEMMEARFVAEEIRDFVREGGELADCAVLFRTQVQPRAFEAELRASGIPYVLVGGMSFFDRKEVRDVLAYLRWSVNPDDETALLRIINTPPRGIGKTSIDRVVAFATEEGISAAAAFERADTIDRLPAGAIESYRELRALVETSRLTDDSRNLVSRVRDFLELVDYRSEVRRLYADPLTREARWAAVEEVLNFAENHARRGAEASLTSFLEELALSTGDDRDTKKEDATRAVTLSTLHAAKGLEFEKVFLVGMEEGILPHHRSVSEGGIEEERRLCYVGITRAKRHLTLSFAAERAKYGRRAVTMPSRFLYEMKGKAPPEDWVPIEAAGDPPEAGEKEASRSAKPERSKKKRKRRGAGRERGKVHRPAGMG